jgi:hypothetical protein
VILEVVAGHRQALLWMVTQEMILLLEVLGGLHLLVVEMVGMVERLVVGLVQTEQPLVVEVVVPVI